MKITFLKSLGLTDTEAQIYSTLLSFDDLSPNTLVNETELQRTTIYHALKTLEQKGLVSKRLKNSKLNYSANNPKDIERYLDHQIESIKGKKQELRSLLPALLKLTKNKNNTFKVNQYEGIEGIKNIIDEALYCHSRHWEIIAPKKNFFSEFDPKYAKYFLNTRLENRIIARSLWEGPDWGRILTEEEIAKRNPRYLPAIMYGKFKSVILLFDDKLALIPSLKEKTAVMIQSQEIHETMLAMFEGLWANSKLYKSK
jgi:sugar-specific transcriptional regulator TrmB